jgi:hypothetical protein
MAGPLDPETGRELYKPETGRAPAFQRNTGGNIGGCRPRGRQPPACLA